MANNVDAKGITRPSFMYDFHGFYQIKIDNDKILKDLHRSFHKFTSSYDEEPDLIIRANIQNTPSVETFLGAPENCYGRKHDKFILKDGGKSVIINEMWDEISISSTYPNIFRTIIEGEIRKKGLTEGLSMIHGSAVRYEGETLIFPAWRHTGKTNLLLCLMMKGGDYLGDDRVLIKNNGEVWAWPTKIHLLPYNYNSFRNLGERNTKEKLQQYISLNIDKFTNGNNSLPYKIVNSLNRILLYESNWKDAETLFPHSETVMSADADKMFLLETSTSKKAPYLTPLQEEELINYLSYINNYEWNSNLEQIYNAHDILFPDRESKSKMFNDAINKEQYIFKEFAKNVDIYKLSLPPEDFWDRELKNTAISLIKNPGEHI